MEPIIQSVLERGDLAHLALFLWAVSASALLLVTLRELFRLHSLFDGFLREFTRFNERAEH